MTLIVDYIKINTFLYYIIMPNQTPYPSNSLNDNLSTLILHIQNIKHDSNENIYFYDDCIVQLQKLKKLISGNFNTSEDLEYLKLINENIKKYSDELFINCKLLQELENNKNNILAKVIQSINVLDIAKNITKDEQKILDGIIDNLYYFLKLTMPQFDFYIKNKNSLTKANNDKEEYEKENKNIKNDLSTTKSELKNLLIKSNNLHGDNELLRQKLYDLENAPIEIIYDNATTKYRKLERSYRWIFIISILLLPFITFKLVEFKKDIILYLTADSTIGINAIQIEYWVIKLSIIVIGITLVTYFLKQSTHYQKLADQNYLTQLEIQAYPAFMNSVPPEQSIEVRKTLALRYFGREIDGSAHKDMSNLISDQMKCTTELIKASAEVVKGMSQQVAKTEPSTSKDTTTP